MLPQPVCVLGWGHVTAFGANSPLGVAASAIGFSRTELVEVEVGNDDVVSVPLVKLDLGGDEESAPPVRRMSLLLGQAVKECLAGVDLARLGQPRSLRAWLALPPPGPGLPDALAGMLTSTLFKAALPVSVAAPEIVVAERAGGLLAITRAATSIAKGQVDLAVVASVDSQVHGPAIKALQDGGRLLTEGVPGGMVPGEGAACLLLCSRRVREQLAAPVAGHLLGVGVADEPNPVGSRMPCAGRGLSDAIRAALGALPASARISDVYADLNGERHRADEWAFTVPRINQRLEEVGRFCSPAPAVGDLGAATGTALLVTALQTAADGEANGTWSLVWTGATGKERAAVLLETSPPSPKPVERVRPPNLQAVAAAEKLLVAEMIEEATAWWGRRRGQQDSLEQSAACDWHQLARIEQRLGHAVRGLCSAAKDVEELCAAGLQDKDPGTVYLWARTNLSRGLAKLAELAGQDPLVDLAIVQALEHGYPPAELGTLITACLARPDLLGDLAVLLASRHGMGVARERLQVAVARLGPTAPVLWAEVLERLGTASDCIRLRSWLGSVEDEQKLPIAQAWLRLGGETVRGELRRFATPWSLAAELLTTPGGLAARARECPESPAYCYALGLTGEPAGVQVLLGRLDSHPDALAAARALDLLTGADLLDGQGKPTCVRAEWNAWLARNASRFASVKRLRLGQACGPATTLAALRRPTLPPSLRRHLVREWERDQRKALLLEVDMLVAEQERALSDAMRAPSQPGRRPA